MGLSCLKIKENLDTPMRLASVRVLGANQTRPSFLRWLLKPHLSAADTDLSTFSDVLKATSSLTRKMLETDIFASVIPKIEAFDEDCVCAVSAEVLALFLHLLELHVELQYGEPWEGLPSYGPGRHFDVQSLLLELQPE